MGADRQSIMLLIVGIVVALGFPWLLFDQGNRATTASERAARLHAPAPRLVDAAKR